MDEDEEYTFAADDKVTAFTQSTPKIPPGFDGRSSWFAFEEAGDDWVDITTLSAEKTGTIPEKQIVWRRVRLQALTGPRTFERCKHWSQVLQRHSPATVCQRRPSSIFMALLSILEELPRPAGPSQMDWPTLGCTQKSPRLMDGPPPSAQHAKSTVY